MSQISTQKLSSTIIKHVLKQSILHSICETNFLQFYDAPFYVIISKVEKNIVHITDEVCSVPCILSPNAINQIKKKDKNFEIENSLKSILNII